MKKKVTKTIGHDRMSLAATYPTGGKFRFTIGRSGERLTWGGSSDAATAREEMKKFMKVAKFQPGETNAQRLDRLEVMAEAVNSMAELVAFIA